MPLRRRVKSHTKPSTLSRIRATKRHGRPDGASSLPPRVPTNPLATRLSLSGRAPCLGFGGSFGGWVYGVAAHGGSPDDRGNIGPQVNSYCDFAGVFGTGVYVTGVAGTSVNNVGVYGQTGELSDQIPQNIAAAFSAQRRTCTATASLGGQQTGPASRVGLPYTPALRPSRYMAAPCRRTRVTTPACTAIRRALPASKAFLMCIATKDRRSHTR
jgi:hypothetical protein